MYFELFADQDLQYNITKHRLQPTFQKLNETECDEYKEKFGVKIGILGIVNSNIKCTIIIIF